VDATAFLDYYVEAVLPLGMPPGPIAIQLFSNAFANAGGNAAAAAWIEYDGTKIAEACAGPSCDPGSPPSWIARKLTIGTFSGVIFEITIAADGSAGVPEGDSNAGIDPYLVVDPSTPNASLVTLVFSPGIDNAPLPSAEVPEPSTWVMILGGFAGLGFAGYLASRKSASNCGNLHRQPPVSREARPI
jgi:hypothetical protein